jgi:Baseplate J-like protein
MPIEPIQLDDRTFEQLFEEARARIPVHTPEWTNFNESDPGITLVRLFAFMTENLLYRSNRIPEANRRKFLTLLGIGLQPASPGQGLISIHNDRGPLLALPVEAGLEVRAGKVPFRTRTGVNILPVTAAAYYKKPHNDLDEETKELYSSLFSTFLERPSDQLTFYKAKQLEAPEIGKPWPTVDLADCGNGTIDHSLWVALIGPQNVPISSVRSTIAGQTLTLGIYPTPKGVDRILPPATSEDNRLIRDPGLVFEIAAPDPDPQNPAVGIGQPKYTRLTLDYADDVLEEPGIVQFRLPEYEKLRLWDYDPEEEGTGDFPPLVEDKELAKRIATWIRIRLPRPEDLRDGNLRIQQQGQLTWVGTNAARVIQALRVENEFVGIGTGAPDQTYRVANTPVITATSAPGEADSTFVLEVQNANKLWETWQLIDDLYAAKPTDQVYTLDPESGIVTFGSGLRGMRPPLGSRIRVTYEYGGGPEGQVAIGAINKSSTLPGGFKVENAMPTWGAQVGESVEEGELNISRYLRHRDRLVTVNDFRDIARRTPGVNMGRVEVLPLFNPEMFDVNNPTQTWPGTVTVMVIPRSDPMQPDAPVPDRLFLDAVCAWLDPRRLVTTEIYVRGPQYVPLWVSVGIVTMAGQMREIVQRNVRVALQEYLSPLTGGPPVVSDFTLDAASPSDMTTNGAKQRGIGWPLSTEVRRQDLEAVATRVAGVRYVDSVKLGIVATDVATLPNVERVPILGLQLPRLVGISVREGTAEDVTTLLGLQPTITPTASVPVPVLPGKC